MLKGKDQAIEEIEMEKAVHVAFCSLRGCHVTPFKKPNGRVAFKVKGAVSTILAELNENPQVRILDFIQRFETIRSIIFGMKTQWQNK